MQPLEEFEQQLLNRHNELRALHGCAPLAWDDSLKETAQPQANFCEANNILQHGGQGDAGQNIFMSYPPPTGNQCTDGWYSEIKDYDFGTGESANGGVVGHFTQVVWSNTTHVGAARSPNGQFVVANYLPAGNWQGEEVENVPEANTEWKPTKEVASAPPAPPESWRTSTEEHHWVIHFPLSTTHISIP